MAVVSALDNSASRVLKATAAATIDATRDKLRLFGLSPEQIKKIETDGTTTDHLTIPAPIGGVVIHKNAQEGMYVKTGSRIYTIADLSKLWVMFEAYESDLPWLRYGQQVSFSSESFPGEMVDAIPDIGENQQIVFTPWMGRSPQDVEDQITYPLTVLLLGIPGVKTVRSYSFFGFSSIYVIFKDDVEFYWSRSRVLEKLNSLPPGTVPTGVQPALGPDATALGQIYWYTQEGRDKNGKATGGWDLHELRTIQDWTVRSQRFLRSNRLLVNLAGLKHRLIPLRSR